MPHVCGNVNTSSHTNRVTHITPTPFAVNVIPTVLPKRVPNMEREARDVLVSARYGSVTITIGEEDSIEVVYRDRWTFFTLLPFEVHLQSAMG